MTGSQILQQNRRTRIASPTLSSRRGALRRALALGTALSGAGAALLAAAPAQAQQLPARSPLTLAAPQLLSTPTRFHARQNEPLPQDLTRLPADRFSAPPIVAPTGGIQIQRTPSWVQPVVSAPAPVADLTIAAPRAAALAGGDVVVEQGDIATTADDMPGVDTVATGTTMITTGNIATQGSNSGGVRAYGYGDMTIHAGDIHTEGYRADGINANTNVGGNSGGIEITAGNIETGGFAASGVRATAYNGSTAITVGSVKTSGYGADGIYGWSYEHDTTINAGTVETSGVGGRGITAYSGGTTTVHVDTVSTTGQGYGTSLDSGAIKAVGAAVEVHAGTVSTTGDYSVGIYANSNFVHDNGQDDHHITVEAGTVTTSGLGSDGITVVNTAQNSQTSIKVDKVETQGDYANGVFGFAPLGSVSIDAGEVATHGTASNGIIAASYYGTVSVHAGTVTTSGENAVGVYSYAGGKQNSAGTTNTVEVGSVSTSGDGAIGIETISLGTQADTKITVGSVSTQGYAATGIRAIADGPGSDITINAGTVETHGKYADGIDAINYALGGKVTITAGQVSTSGDYTAGIFSYASSGDTNISVGSVSTSGNLSFGISAGDRYGDVHVDAGSVSTTGDSSFGISASGINVSVEADTVETKGYLGVGIQAGAMDDVTVKAGSITTEGDLARGIDASGTNVTITAGDITTDGFGSNAINAVAYGTGSVDVTTTGHIATKDVYSDAVAAFAGGNVAVHNQGQITTEATGGRGVYAVSFGGGDISVTGAGTIDTKGLGAKGVYAITYGGSISVDQSHIGTAGDNAAGIYALSLDTGIAQDSPNTITIHAGDVVTQGYQSHGIRTFANAEGVDVSVSAGSVETHGDRAWGIYASTLSGNVSVDVGSVTTSGEGAVGVSARSVYGDVDLTADSVHVGADYTNAIEAVSTAGQGDVHVKVKDASSGAYSNTILASGHSVTLEIDGKIDKSGSYSAVVAIASGGDVAIANNGTITTTNGGPNSAYLANGIYARADGNVTVNGHGMISTDSQFGDGVNAYSNRGGAITVSQDAISTAGGQSNGVVAVTSNRIGAEPSYGAGGITVTLGSLSTKGFGASGMLLSDNTKLGSAMAIVTGDLTTEGDQARGVSIYSANQTAGAQLNNVSTKGYYAQAVHLDGNRAELNFGGNVSTEGVLSTAIVAYAGNGGIKISGGGAITTKGEYFSAGVRASSPGDIAIDVGTVSTVGRGSNGIEVTEAKRHSEVYPYEPQADAKNGASDLANGFPFPDPRDPETATTGSTISVTVKGVTTAGANSDGIMVSTTTGNADIHSGTVAVTGKNSIGIFAEGRNVRADTGNTSSAQSTAIALQGFESAQLAVHGKVSGGVDGVLLQSYHNSLTVTSGATISGAVNGITIDATPHVTPRVQYWGYAPESYIGQDTPQPLPPANPAAGTARIDNAGTITGGSGYAIAVSGGGVDVANSGIVVGAVKFSAFADTFTNSGTFIATKNSDFGGGGDVFVNSGTFKLGLTPTTAQARLAAAAAGGTSVSLLNLATFKNSGIIDLRNGTGGDVLTLSGAYVGSGKALLGLDVTAGGADRLVIGGAATGSTAILLDVTPEGARLLGSPVQLVKVGAGSAASAFTLANASVGLVQYNLAFDAASGSFGLSAQAGAPVYRLLKLDEGAQAIWNQSADAWSSHMADLRDLPGQGGLWGQAYGSVANRNETRSIAGTAYSFDYRQDYFGGQAGYDFGGDKLVFGVTAGYLNSNLNMQGSGERIRYDSLNTGGYVGYNAGAFFVNGLVQYAHYWANARDRIAVWSDDTNGDDIGGKVEIGARLGSGKFFAEPIAAIAYQRSSFGALQALGQTIDPENNSGFTGSLGARLGSSFGLKGGAKATVYARGLYVHQFDGEGALTFDSGSTSERLVNRRLGDYGQFALGLNIGGTGKVSGFLEGNATAGKNGSGGGGRVGLRFKF